MSLWTALIWVAVIFAAASLLRARARARAGITEDGMDSQTLPRSVETTSEPRDEAAETEIRELKERIAVLERIATDANTPSARDSAALASEIEALRTPSAEANTNLASHGRG